MAKQLFTNNARTTLAGPIGNSATTATLATGTGALFPTPIGGDFFQLTLLTSTGGVESDIEIVTVTARSGDVITMTRGQEGTTAVSHAAGSVAAIRDTAKFFNDTSAALEGAEYVANKGAASGYMGLDGSFRALLKNAAGTITSLLASAAISARTWTFPDKSGTVAMLDDITGTNSGTNTGDQTITLTGDVAGSGTGSFAATIAANAVTLAKFQQIATASFIGRNTAGTGNAEVLSTTTSRTLLSVNNVDNTSDLNKPISTATQTALDLKQNLSGKDAASGYGGLDASYRHIVKNTAGTVSSLLTSVATTARTYSLPDATGTLVLAATTLAGYGITDAQATITGAATTITTSNLTASRAVVSDGSGKVAVSAVTTTELGYVAGVTSALQTQIDGKQSTSGKNAASGYAGLSATYQVQMRNVANTFTSLLQNTNTAARTYSLPDRDGTLADNTDLALKANLASPTFTGTPVAPTAAVDTNTTQLATTAYYIGQRGTATPLVNGTATAGTSVRFSPIDHVHPTDTSRAAIGANSFTGNQNLQDNQLSRASMLDCAAVVVPKGNSGTSTQTFDYTAGSSNTLTATGNHTWAFSNWPASGNEGFQKVRVANGGLYTITFPTINWRLPTGGHTTNFATYLAAIGRSALQSADVDEFLFWTTDAGTTVYGKLI